MRPRLPMQGTQIWTQISRKIPYASAQLNLSPQLLKLVCSRAQHTSCNCWVLVPRARAPQEKPPQKEACAVQLERSPCSSQLEKAQCSQKINKNGLKNFLNIWKSLLYRKMTTNIQKNDTTEKSPLYNHQSITWFG